MTGSIPIIYREVLTLDEHETSSMNTMTRYRSLLVVLVMFVATVGMTVPVSGEVGDPGGYYGAAEDEDGDPIPPGAELVAVVDGDVEDTIEIEEAGKYGGPTGADPKLTVTADDDDQVSFHLNDPDGPEAIESPVDFESGTNELDLTFESGTFGFQITDVDAPDTALVGQELDVTAELENTGVENTETITLSLDDDQVDSTDETLAFEDTDSVTLSYEPDDDDIGENRIFTVETENDDDSVDIDIQEPQGNYSVSITDVVDEVDEGEELTVEYEIENIGDELGEQDIDFLVNDELVANESGVTLEVDETFEDSFTYTPDRDDAFEISVTVASDDDSDTATVSVNPEVFYEITDSDLGPDEIEPGDELSVDATIQNQGFESGNQTVVWSLNDDELDSEIVELDPDENTTVEFDAEIDEDPDTYTQTISTDEDEVSQELEVEEEEEEDDDGLLPSWIVIPILLGLFVILLVLVYYFVTLRDQEIGLVGGDDESPPEQ